MEDFSSVFYSAPSGKGSNTAILGLTTFLVAASTCKVVRKKKTKRCVSTRKTLKIKKTSSPKTFDTVKGSYKHNSPDLWDRGSIYICRLLSPFVFVNTTKHKTKYSNGCGRNNISGSQVKSAIVLRKATGVISSLFSAVRSQQKHYHRTIYTEHTRQ